MVATAAPGKCVWFRSGARFRSQVWRDPAGKRAVVAPSNTCGTGAAGPSQSPANQPGAHLVRMPAGSAHSGARRAWSFPNRGVSGQ